MRLFLLYREFQVMKYRRTFIEDLLEARPEDRERCNMLLLFLVVGACIHVGNSVMYLYEKMYVDF